MSEGRPTWVEIDLGALRHNLRQIQDRVGSGCGVMGVVKANAYGHGAVLVARTLLQGGADQLAVATVAEALELRDAGIDAPILVFAGRYQDRAQALWQAQLEAVVFGHDVLDALEAQRPEGAPALRLHLQVDSGMGRLGCDPSAFVGLWQRIEETPCFELAGLMSHLAGADDKDVRSTTRQLQTFEALTAALPGVSVPRHVANSAAIAQHPQAHYDRVRPGLALYGVEPVQRHPLGLLPVMSWYTEIAHLRRLSRGHAVGYGGRWKATRDSVVGILPVGYADGYPWCAEGKGWVLIDGQRAPLIGAVSMDMIAVDLTDLDDLEVGTQVVLMGGSGDETLDASQLAAWSQRLVYEVLTSVGPRVPRRVRTEAEDEG